MIKINLLETAEAARPRTEEAGFGGESHKLVGIVFGASLLGSLAIAGLLGWYWSREVDRLQARLRQAQAEQARLASIRSENDRYVSEIQQLEARVNTIEQLESSRAGPVQLMNAIADTVSQTNHLYLESVNAEASRLTFKGESESVRAIADFITALKRDASFQDIELRQYYQDDQKSRVFFKFDLDCIFTPARANSAAARSAPRVAAPKSKA